MEPLKDLTLEAAGGGVVGLGALWLWIRRLAVQNATDGTAIDAAHAKSDVIQMLRDEIKRMAEVNNDLVTALNSAHLQIGGLQAEIAALRATVTGMSGVVDTIAHRKDDGGGWDEKHERRASRRPIQIGDNDG